ncbi:uncharacterized protein SETTUDRAFT_162234 [Exserohilum turcica Et28A]|uniref:Uncharacterized protein n=1 Tax=Exserohilum turcicum (strain 28A) TaxID=671987 RepID=R0KR91_EXST2|nr:uncharacterized protein SETTUDRAFT_162234 [Exserohilum turcica Et28A]EOA91524.1 hypothetical protein SETTUDRAFT_162234 [Exserohilum turcica Et28A]
MGGFLLCATKVQSGAVHRICLASPVFGCFLASGLPLHHGVCSRWLDARIARLHGQAMSPASVSNGKTVASVSRRNGRC